MSKLTHLAVSVKSRFKASSVASYSSTMDLDPFCLDILRNDVSVDYLGLTITAFVKWDICVKIDIKSLDISYPCD